MEHVRGTHSSRKHESSTEESELERDGEYKEKKIMKMSLLRNFSVFLFDQASRELFFLHFEINFAYMYARYLLLFFIEYFVFGVVMPSAPSADSCFAVNSRNTLLSLSS